MSRAAIVLGVIIPLAWTSSAEAAGRVWKVGPGQPFTTIQSAVNAAGDGDAVLVSPGTYAGFTITGKALAVVQDGPTKPLISGQVLIEYVPEDNLTVLDGFTIRSTSVAIPALRTQQNAGGVRIIRCQVEGCDNLSDWYTAAGIALSSELDDDLVLTASSAFGGDGLSGKDFPPPSDAGSAVIASTSTLAAYACTFRGGLGGSNFEEGYDGGYGGHGLWAVRGEISVTGCSLFGGAGGRGGDEDGFPPKKGNYAGDGGKGGNGMLLAGGANAPDVIIQSSQFTGGAGGPGGSGGPSGQPGTPGIAYNNVPGAVTTLPGPARLLRGATLAREGEAKTLTFEGEPGDQVYLALTTSAPRSGVGNVPARRNLSLNPPMFVGTVPANGILIHRMAIGDAVRGADVRWFILEPSFVDTVGATHTANELVWVLVDTGF